jgi:uncharacterized heparinase superfamily protein
VVHGGEGLVSGLQYAERLAVLRFVLARAMTNLRYYMRTPLRLAAALTQRHVERLLIAPQDIRTADPTIANDIYAGYFAFAAKIVETHAQSPFLIEPPSGAWAQALHGFGWLRHLRAADTMLARANGRALVHDWLIHCERPQRGPAWTAPVVARRLMSWLSQSPIILEGADGLFYRQFMAALHHHSTFLRDALEHELLGEERLIAAIALMDLSLCAQDMGRLQKRAEQWLCEELERQILPDGGHISRNPQMLIDLMLDLLPLRQAFSARAAPIPPALVHALDRMMPMLRMLRHDDGALALFNGMGVTPIHAMATILAYDEARTGTMLNAPFTAYQRFEGRDVVVLMDCGGPPPAVFSKHAHAGALAFEMSVRGQRMIVNCGAPDPARTALVQAARTTAAHSTLALADTSSLRFAQAGGIGAWLEGRVIAGIDVKAKRFEHPQGQGVEASHHGYEPRFGVVHERRLFVRDDGALVQGEDRLIARGGAGHNGLSAAVRFHLHPHIKVAVSDDGLQAYLTLPDGETWQFDAYGCPIIAEESIFMADPEGVRACQQLILMSDLGEQRALSWTLQPLASPAPQN